MMRERNEPVPFVPIDRLPGLEPMSLNSRGRAVWARRPAPTALAPEPEGRVLTLTEDPEGYMVTEDPAPGDLNGPRRGPAAGEGHPSDGAGDDLRAPSTDTDDVGWTPPGADPTDQVLQAALPPIPALPTAAELAMMRTASQDAEHAAPAALPPVPSLPPPPLPRTDTVWEIGQADTAADGTLVITVLRKEAVAHG